MISPPSRPLLVPPDQVDVEKLVKQAQRSLLQQQKAMDNAVNRYQAAPLSNSPVARDESHLKNHPAQQRLYVIGWKFALLLLANTGDHLLSIRESAKGRRVFAHLTAARACLESAARVRYLLPAELTVEDRVLRAAAAILEDVHQERSAARSLTSFGPAPAEQAASRARDAHDLVKRAGVEVRTGQFDRPTGVRWAGNNSMPWVENPKITSLVRGMLPDKPGAYQVASAAVHGLPWILDNEEAFNDQTGTFSWTFDPLSLAMSVDLAISAASAVTTTFARMCGHDPHTETIHAHRRNEAVGWYLHHGRVAGRD